MDLIGDAAGIPKRVQLLVVVDDQFRAINDAVCFVSAQSFVRFWLHMKFCTT